MGVLPTLPTLTPFPQLPCFVPYDLENTLRYVRWTFKDGVYTLIHADELDGPWEPAPRLWRSENELAQEVLDSFPLEDDDAQ